MTPAPGGSLTLRNKGHNHGWPISEQGTYLTPAGLGVHYA